MASYIKFTIHFEPGIQPDDETLMRNIAREVARHKDKAKDKKLWEGYWFSETAGVQRYEIDIDYDE